MGSRRIRVVATVAVAVAASLSGTSGARPPAADHDGPAGRAEATGDGQPKARTTAATPVPAPADVAAPGPAAPPCEPVGTTGPAAPAERVAVAPAAVAPAAVAPGSSDDSPPARAAEALTRISYPWQTRLEGWSVTFLPARPGYLGATWSEPRRIEIYVRDDQSVGELAFTIAHELGHAVDITYLDADDRSAWLAARGAGQTQWWPTSGASDYAVGAGDWAEAFAVWQVGGPSMSTLAGQPTLGQLELLADQASG